MLGLLSINFIQGEPHMSGDEYLLSMVNKYKAPEYDFITEAIVIEPIRSKIREWAGDKLLETKKSGSRAKGTAISVTSDYDLFVSLSSDLNMSLKDIYNSLFATLSSAGYKARKQNVSIGIENSGHKIDVTPGRKYSGNTNFHSIYRNKVDSWTQTNIDLQVNTVANSERINEVIILKIWRYLNGLAFPSMYLELMTLEALYYKSKNDLGNNVWEAFKYFRDNIVDKVVIDPSNTNNRISDDLYKYEKEAIAQKANDSLSKKNWSEIIW